jgi:hypothetical protein
MRDRQTDSFWTSLGRAVSGPLGGRSLTLLDGQQAYWFAWAAFNRDTEIHGHAGSSRPGQGGER